MSVDDIAFDDEVGPPERIEDLLARQGGAGVRGEEVQQGLLRARDQVVGHERQADVVVCAALEGVELPTELPLVDRGLAFGDTSDDTAGVWPTLQREIDGVREGLVSDDQEHTKRVYGSVTAGR